MKHLALLAILAAAAMPCGAAEPLRCKHQKVENVVIDMYVQPGGAFQHDLYLLRADKVLIFSLVDDYAEKVELEHTVPTGEVIEFPLSMQGSRKVKITGGCVPEEKDGSEVARVCNFFGANIPW